MGGRVGNGVYCLWWYGTPVGGEAHVSIPVTERYTRFYRGERYETRCGGAGPDCYLLALDGTTVLAATTIHFGPPRGEPAVTVTPSTDVRPGDVMQVTVTGLGHRRNVRASLCTQAALVELEQNPGLLFPLCQWLGSGALHVDPLEVEAPLVDTWWTNHDDRPPIQRCGARPGGCVVVVSVNDDGGNEILLVHDIDVEPDPLTLAPDAQEVGVALDAFAYLPDRAGETVTVAQCTAPVPATASGRRCAPGIELTLDDIGEGAAQLVPVEAIRAAGADSGGASGDGDGGDDVDCTQAACAVAVIGADGATAATAPLTVFPADGPLTLDVTPSGPYHQGDSVQMDLTGTRNLLLWVGQCAAEVLDDRHVDAGRCSTLQGHWAGSTNPTLTTWLDATRRITTSAGTDVECSEPDACVFAVESDAGDFVWAPAQTTAPPTASLDPATDLLDGQDVTYTVTGIRPQDSYPMQRCDGPDPAVARCLPMGVDAVSG
ncbi:MAG TPA: hypothetical protein VIL36_19360, partial [Acidimicrobiales bacterium]